MEVGVAKVRITINGTEFEAEEAVIYKVKAKIAAGIAKLFVIDDAQRARRLWLPRPHRN